MIRPSLLRWSTSMALIGALALAGCSDDTKPDAAGPTVEEGPLTKMLNAAYGEYDQEDSDRKQIEVENLVADCMAAEGFEYTPYDYASNSVSFSEEDWEDQNTKEWVATNGYGMSMDTTEEVDPEEDPSQDWVDPNADYVNALSESQQAAYYEVLWGPSTDMTEEEMEEYVYTWEDSGCQGAAQHEIFAEQDLFTDPRFEDLLDSMNDLYSEALQDPQLVEVSAEWADCMADAGYPGFATPDDALTSVNDAQNAMYNWEGEMDEEYTGPSSEALAEFRELEIATAVADFDCKQKVDWEAISSAVAIKREEVFVKENQAALDEYVAALQDARK